MEKVREFTSIVTEVNDSYPASQTWLDWFTQTITLRGGYEEIEIKTYRPFRVKSRRDI